MNKTTNVKFMLLYNKLVDNFKTLQTFYINRFLLEIDYGTIEIIMDEILLSIVKLRLFISNSVFDNKKNLLEKKLLLLIKKVNKLNIIIYSVFNYTKFNNNECISSDDVIKINRVDLSEDNINFICSEEIQKVKIIDDNFNIISKDVTDEIKNNKYYLADNITFSLLYEKILIEANSFKKVYLFTRELKELKKKNKFREIIDKISLPVKIGLFGLLIIILYLADIIFIK